jgi:hypothetical protein
MFRTGNESAGTTTTPTTLTHHDPFQPHFARLPIRHDPLQQVVKVFAVVSRIAGKMPGLHQFSQ